MDGLWQGREVSAEEKAFFLEQGYLCLRNFAGQQECDILENRIHTLLDSFDPNEHRSVFTTHESKREYDDDYFLGSGDKIRFFWEDDIWHPDGTLKYPKSVCINKIGHSLHVEDPVFRAYTLGKLRALAYSLGFEDPIPLQGMYIFKQPRIGGEVNAHQDNTFLLTDPFSVMGFWLGIHGASGSNGCLQVVPGSHKTHHPPAQKFVRLGKAGPLAMQPEKVDPLPREPAVCLETEPGDLVILHGSLVHYSSKNTSSKPRHAFTVHVIEGQAHYLAENWLQYAEGASFPRFESIG